MSDLAREMPFRLNRKRINYKHLVLHVILLCVCLATMFPFIWMISSSLKDSELIFSYPPELIPNPVCFSNYQQAWQESRMGGAMVNSLIIAITATVGNCFVSSLVAYGFAKTEFKGKSTLFMIVMCTMMIPYQVTLIPMFIIFRQFGWINTFNPLIVPSLFG
ncbi:MAG: carbohydrate ABC transporter permease, partial [Clostridia bacterium]